MRTRLLVKGLVVASIAMVACSRTATPPLANDSRAAASSVFRADCSAGFIDNQCVACHQLDGLGAQRANLTPLGVEQLQSGSGCIAALSTIVSQKQDSTDVSAARISVIRSHFQEFGCQRCHDVDAEGQTRANLSNYGLSMHRAGMGCLRCLNALKTAAGRDDLLLLPSIFDDGAG